MTISTNLPSPSERSKRFSRAEGAYLMKVLAAMQNPVQTSTVKMWLEKAQPDGLDPRRIYEVAVNARPPHWTPDHADS